MKSIDFLPDSNYNKNVINVRQKVGAHVGENGKTKI